MLPTDWRFMEQSVTATLINALTSDELVQTGALIRPLRETNPLAVLWIHGGGQNFYYPTYLRIGAALSAYGYAFLSANTHGHDYNSQWDLFEHAALDLAAWIDRLTALGYPQVVLAGHSFGGWRVASYQAERHDPRVRGPIIASTPLRKRLSWSQLPQYQERLTIAERMVAEGKGDQFMPLPYPQTAASFVSLDRAAMDLYGLETGEQLLDQVGCPVLAWFGTENREPSIGTAADLDEARAALPSGFPFTTVLLQGADHVYRGCEDEVAATIARWAKQLS
jgi:pimeloyl-ACP methyl ester carboxylesterase